VQVAGQRLLGSGVDLDAVAGDEGVEQGGVPGLLEALQRHRFAQQRRRLLGGVGRHLGAGAALGADGFVPEGQGAQLGDVLLAELRPRQRRRLELPVRLDEVATEKREMLLGPNAHAALWLLGRARSSARAVGRRFDKIARAA
jgi:hypothetical protein